MDNFRIFETESFQRDLEQDFGGQQDRIKNKLLGYVYPQLSAQPYFGKNIKKMVNYRLASWRYRIGNYRFFYEIDDRKRIVFMTAADIRGDAY